MTNRIDVSNEIILPRYRPLELDLQVPLRLVNARTAILTEAVQQLDTLMHAIPTISVRVLQVLISIHRPVPREDCCRIVASKQSCKSIFEGSSKQHARACVLLLPAVQITVPIAARAGEALAIYPDCAELKRECPELEDEDIRQALAFAAALVDDKVLPLPQTR